MNRKLFSVFVLSLVAAVLCACGIVRGSGNVISVTRYVHDFDQVTLSGVGTLYVSVGEKESLTIEAEDNLLPFIETHVQENRLDIGINQDSWNMAIQPTRPIYYYLTVTDLEGLELSGAGNIEIDELDTPHLRIISSGAGNIEIDRLVSEGISADVSGAGSCHIYAGEVKNQDLRISGVGGYQAGELKSETTDIDISGLGGARVWVENLLSVTISGAGNVDFYGRPDITQDVSGLGNLNSLGAKD